MLARSQSALSFRRLVGRYRGPYVLGLFATVAALGCHHGPPTPEKSGLVPVAVGKSSPQEFAVDERVASTRPLPPTGAGTALSAGGRVRLRAQHPAGVPVHARAHQSAVSRRLADGAEVTILSADEEQNWLRIQPASGPEGFIVRRYVEGYQAHPVHQGAEARASPEFAASVATSRTECLARLPALLREAANRRVVRLGTFNVRWFPDGGPGKKPPISGGTDLEWLACLIASTGVEALALQEIKTLPRAQASMTTVLRHLDRMTQGTWRAAFDDCPEQSTQHVGIAFDAKRVTAFDRRTIAELNPHGSACKDSLRPGLALRLLLSDRTEVDFVSVHFKSGTEPRALALRARTRDALSVLGHSAPRLLVVAGDLNTMGCPSCSPSQSAAMERALTKSAAEKSGLSLVDPVQGCSHYYRSQPLLLDGFVTSLALATRAHSFTAGACAASECAPGPVERSDVARTISDHCPLVLELAPPN